MEGRMKGWMGEWMDGWVNTDFIFLLIKKFI